MVTDKRDHPVSGLQQSDFTVFEDDKPQRIVWFSKSFDETVEAASASPASASNRGTGGTIGTRGPDSPTRTYLVCVDTLHSSLGNMTQARHALRKFFEKEQDADAQYALMSLGRQISVIQDSTRDASGVVSALGSKKFQSSMMDSEASSIALDADRLRDMLTGFSPQACTTRTAGVRGPNPDYCSDMERRVRTYIGTSSERTAVLTRDFLAELRSLIKAMANMPTKRTLILISDGFNLVPGRELYGIAAAYFPNDPEWRMSNRDTQNELNELLRMAQRDNVVMYALDSRGVYTPAANGLGDASHRGDGYATSGLAMQEMMRDEGRVAWENGNAMAELAGGTRGLYFHDNNDLLTGLRKAFNDERERYVLAYVPTNEAADAGYRKIRVEVKGKDLRVHAKAGYWATPN